jgi:hypothetical protein
LTASPYSAQWNFDLQYELPSEMLLDVAYAGNSGVKLLAQAQLNQLPDQYLALGDDLNRSVANPFFGVVPATSGIGQRTTTVGQLLRPYPHLTGLQQTYGSLSHSSYHSLQAKFRKRYRNGLQMQASYTWAKMLDDFSSVGGYGVSYPGFTNNNQRWLGQGSFLIGCGPSSGGELPVRCPIPFRVESVAGCLGQLESQRHFQLPERPACGDHFRRQYNQLLQWDAAP